MRQNFTNYCRPSRGPCGRAFRISLDAPDTQAIRGIQRRRRVIAPLLITVFYGSRLNQVRLGQHRAGSQPPTVIGTDIIADAGAGKPHQHVPIAIHHQRRHIVIHCVARRRVVNPSVIGEGQSPAVHIDLKPEPLNPRPIHIRVGTATHVCAVSSFQPHRLARPQKAGADHRQRRLARDYAAASTDRLQRCPR